MYCLNDHFKTRNFQNFFIESNMILHIYTESQILLIALWGNFEKKKKKKNNVCIEKFEVNYGEAWRRQWHPTPVLLPGKSHGRRSLEGCRPWGRWGSDTTERLHFHFSLSCIGEGNGNPSGVLAWRIQGMGEPGGLPSMGSHRVGHDWSDLAAAAAAWWNCLLQAISQENKS